VLLSEWSVYLTVLHMIERSKVNDMDDMTQKGMLLDVSISPKIKIRKKNTPTILFSFDCSSGYAKSYYGTLNVLSSYICICILFLISPFVGSVRSCYKWRNICMGSKIRKV